VKDQGEANGVVKGVQVLDQDPPSYNNIG